MPRWLHLAELALVALLTATLFFSWRADRHDRAALAAQLASAQQTLKAAGDRQHDRDAQLAQTLASIAAQKRSADSATPQQLLAALQQQIGLPIAPTLQPNQLVLAVAQHAAQRQENDRTGKGSNASEQGSASPRKTGASVTATPARLQPFARVDEIAAQSGAEQFPAGSQPVTDAKPSSPPQLILPNQDLKPLYNFALDCQACQAKLAAAQGDLADERAKSAALTRERDAALRASKGGTLWRRFTRAAKWFAIGAAAGALAAKSSR